MKRPPAQWPHLLRDGCWRAIPVETEYFPKYFRWHRGVRQIVFLNYTLRQWCLLRMGRRQNFYTPCPDLDKALLLADVTPTRRPVTT